ncbi:hypothetical protein [Ruegeria lacuscaerulensis]|uniref:hypothetical protein n=1 Tax=Ruegeria lacuscaerulensis TaxID=55218 RepID=UPI00147B0152|nr:hypothetical protein [Ruegeria lacuscaerulensis]
MSKEPNTKEENKRPLKAFTSDDLVSEIKARITTGELRALLLFDGNTGRVYSDLGAENRRCFCPRDMLRMVFPFQDFNTDSAIHKRIAEFLFDLSDEDFFALKSTVAAEKEEGIRRLFARLKEPDVEEDLGEPDTGDPADD